MCSEDGSIFLSQRMYAERVLAKFNMVESKSVVTPSEEITVSMEEEKSLYDTVPYYQAVGSLMYLTLLLAQI